MQPVEVSQGNGPIVLGVPHAGTFVPDRHCAQASTTTGLKLCRHRLACRPALCRLACQVRPWSRPTSIATSLTPTGTRKGSRFTRARTRQHFARPPISTDAPSTTPAENRMPDEIEARRLAWHAPYHAALQAELERVRAQHGVAILYDCHSIRSVVPFLFDGTLPDFNTGTNNGATCAPEIEAAVVRPHVKCCGGLHVRAERPFQGRLDHAALWPPGK